MKTKGCGDGELLYCALLLEEARIVRLDAMTLDTPADGSGRSLSFGRLADESRAHHACLLEEWRALGAPRVPAAHVRRWLTRLLRRVGTRAVVVRLKLLEQISRGFYRFAVKRAINPEVRSLFEALAEAESMHASDLATAAVTC